MTTANFGEASNLVSGTITLTLPSGCKYWYIQNQDVQPLLVTFNTMGIGAVALGPATAQGGAGDWIDSTKFPWFGPQVVLTSTLATAQFGCGRSLSEPGGQ